MRRCAPRSLALPAALFLAAVARADVTIDTTPGWDGSSAVSSFGYPDTATYGETLTAPAGPNTHFSSFTVEIRVNSGPLTLSGYVYAWDGREVTGPQLYKSPAIVVPTNASEFQQVTMTPNVDLTAGGHYIAFFSVTEYYAANAAVGSTSAWGQVGDNLDPGGEFAYTNNGGSAGGWSSPWTLDYLGPGNDLAFRATFTGLTPVPEPASLAMMGLGGIGLVGSRAIRRRLRAATVA